MRDLLWLRLGFSGQGLCILGAPGYYLGGNGQEMECRVVGWTGRLGLAYTIDMCAVLREVTSTLCNPMDCSLPGSSVQGIFQVGIPSGLTFPPPGYLPSPGIEPPLLHWQTGSLPLAPPGKSRTLLILCMK